MWQEGDILYFTIMSLNSLFPFYLMNQFSRQQIFKQDKLAIKQRNTEWWNLVMLAFSIHNSYLEIERVVFVLSYTKGDCVMWRTKCRIMIGTYKIVHSVLSYVKKILHNYIVQLPINYSKNFVINLRLKRSHSYNKRIHCRIYDKCEDKGEV